jgi:Lar family restriction alleviation protein
MNRGWELDPCPFCGGKAKLNHTKSFIDEDGGYWVSCTKCEVQQGFSYREEEAVERWNTRWQRKL